MVNKRTMVIAAVLLVIMAGMAFAQLTNNYFVVTVIGEVRENGKWAEKSVTYPNVSAGNAEQASASAIDVFISVYGGTKNTRKVRVVACYPNKNPR